MAFVVEDAEREAFGPVHAGFFGAASRGVVLEADGVTNLVEGYNGLGRCSIGVSGS